MVMEIRQRDWALVLFFVIIAVAAVIGAVASNHSTSHQMPGYGTVCKDGWGSQSSGRGTCSHHGGEAN